MAKPPIEAIIGQYSLKATFFANTLFRGGYFELFSKAEATISALSAGLDWGDTHGLGIDKELLVSLGVTPQDYGKYYCHPAVLEANPWLLKYYRTISAFSQKGIKSITGVSNVEKIENGLPCKNEQAKKLTFAINQNLNLIFGAIGHTEESRKGMMYATTGSSIEGSWRNAIGTEGERVVNTMLLKVLYGKGELKALVTKKGKTVGVEQVDEEWIEKETPDLISALCTNGSVVKFGSEPDLTCIKPDGGVSAGVEVKAGLDPAGALERLGAMLKSFEHVLSQEPSAETILVVACVTDTVQERLNATRNVSRVYVLTDIINDPRGKGMQLCNILRGCLGLVQKRL
jgi:hypothetical protein